MLRGECERAERIPNVCVAVTVSVTFVNYLSSSAATIILELIAAEKPSVVCYRRPEIQLGKFPFRI